jgi:hypothetical protein
MLHFAPSAPATRKLSPSNAVARAASPQVTQVAQGDDDVVRVALAQAGGGDADELGARPHRLEKDGVQPGSVSFTDCLVTADADRFAAKAVFGFEESFAKNGYATDRR